MDLLGFFQFDFVVQCVMQGFVILRHVDSVEGAFSFSMQISKLVPNLPQV